MSESFAARASAPVLCNLDVHQLSAEQMLLNNLLQRFQELGLLKAHGRQHTDSTQVLAVIRDLGRLECITETLRYALNAVAEEAPNWLTTLAPPEWYERYSKRIEESHLPRKPMEREEFAELVGGDGFKLMAAIYRTHLTSSALSE